MYGNFESRSQVVGQVDSFQPLSLLPIAYDTLYGFHADQLHGRDVFCGPREPKVRGSHFQGHPAVDLLENNVWICRLALGTSADELLWDGYAPFFTRGDFFDFEVCGHDGAYKGHVHVIVPFFGQKNDSLSAWQNCGLIGTIRRVVPTSYINGCAFCYTLPGFHQVADMLPSVWTVRTCSTCCLEEHPSNR